MYLEAGIRSLELNLKECLFPPPFLISWSESVNLAMLGLDEGQVDGMIPAFTCSPGWRFFSFFPDDPE